MDTMQTGTSTTLACLECRREWLDPGERWRMYAIFGEEPEHGLYCPVCASFEFDD
jgi:hypothetical protein